MNESSKSRRLFTPEERQYFRGRVLDIGAGEDPVMPEAVAFDQAQGDANHITAFAPGSFDCVYSSHCLEHMDQPVATLSNWWSLVKPGGILFVIVPDEDLYEQGRFPSRFNDDHKSTFTLSKKSSWSPRSHNLLEMALGLPQSQLVSLRLNDIGYDRRFAGHTPIGQAGSPDAFCASTAASASAVLPDCTRWKCGWRTPKVSTRPMMRPVRRSSWWCASADTRRRER